MKRANKMMLVVLVVSAMLVCLTTETQAATHVLAASYATTQAQSGFDTGVVLSNLSTTSSAHITIYLYGSNPPTIQAFDIAAQGQWVAVLSTYGSNFQGAVRVIVEGDDPSAVVGYLAVTALSGNSAFPIPLRTPEVLMPDNYVTGIASVGNFVDIPIEAIGGPNGANGSLVGWKMKLGTQVFTIASNVVVNGLVTRITFADPQPNLNNFGSTIPFELYGPGETPGTAMAINYVELPMGATFPTQHISLQRTGGQWDEDFDIAGAYPVYPYGSGTWVMRIVLADPPSDWTIYGPQCAYKADGNPAQGPAFTCLYYPFYEDLPSPAFYALPFYNPYTPNLENVGCTVLVRDNNNQWKPSVFTCGLFTPQGWVTRVFPQASSYIRPCQYKVTGTATNSAGSYYIYIPTTQWPQNMLSGEEIILQTKYGNWLPFTITANSVVGPDTRLSLSPMPNWNDYNNTFAYSMPNLGHGVATNAAYLEIPTVWNWDAGTLVGKEIDIAKVSSGGYVLQVASDVGVSQGLRRITFQDPQPDLNDCKFSDGYHYMIESPELTNTPTGYIDTFPNAVVPVKLQDKDGNWQDITVVGPQITQTKVRVGGQFITETVWRYVVTGGITGDEWDNYNYNNYVCNYKDQSGQQWIGQAYVWRGEPFYIDVPAQKMSQAPSGQIALQANDTTWQTFNIGDVLTPQQTYGGWRIFLNGVPAAWWNTYSSSCHYKVSGVAPTGGGNNCVNITDRQWPTDALKGQEIRLQSSNGSWHPFTIASNTLLGHVTRITLVDPQPDWDSYGSTFAYMLPTETGTTFVLPFIPQTVGNTLSVFFGFNSGSNSSYAQVFDFHRYNASGTDVTASPTEPRMLRLLGSTFNMPPNPPQDPSQQNFVIFNPSTSYSSYAVLHYRHTEDNTGAIVEDDAGAVFGNFMMFGNYADSSGVPVINLDNYSSANGLFATLTMTGSGFDTGVALVNCNKTPVTPTITFFVTYTNGTTQATVAAQPQTRTAINSGCMDQFLVSDYTTQIQAAAQGGTILSVGMCVNFQGIAAVDKVVGCCFQISGSGFDYIPLEPMAVNRVIVYAANQASLGIDTGIALQNRTDGPVQLNLVFHGINAPSTPVPPVSLAPHETWCRLLSQIASEFQGYITIEMTSGGGESLGIATMLYGFGSWQFASYIPSYPDAPLPQISQAPVHNAAIVNGVNLASGEFIYSASDLHVAGVSGDISIIRTYRSFTAEEGIDGAVGLGWHLNQDKWVKVNEIDNTQVEYYDGSGLIHTFILTGSQGGTYYYEDLRGLFATMTRTGSSGNYAFTMLSADHSTQLAFNSTADSQDRYHINTITTPTVAIGYTYNSGWLLTAITNGYATVHLTYNSSGLLSSVYLDSNYCCTYNHDSAGNLTAARPNGSCAVNYDYSTNALWGISLLARIRLNDEANHVVLRNIFDTANFRVDQQEFPYGANPAEKAVVKYRYYNAASWYGISKTYYIKVAPGTGTEDVWRTYYFNNLGNPICVSLTDSVNDVPSIITTTYAYNDDCLTTLVANPGGNGTVFTYDTSAYHSRHSNLVEERTKTSIAAPNNDYNDIVIKHSYYLTDDAKANHPMADSDPNYPDEPLSGTYGDHVTYYEYDSNGNCNLISRPDPAGGTNRVNTSFTYYSSNLLHTMVSPSPTGSGTTTTELVYSANRLSQQIADSGGLNLTTTFSYYPTGALQTSCSPQGVSTSIGRDYADRVTSTATAGRTQVNEYDNYGCLSSTGVITGGNYTSREWYEYDWQGCMTKRVTGLASLSDKNASGQITTTYGYDDNGNLISSTDPENRVTTTQYNRRNQPVCTISAGQYLSRTTYDYNGNVICQWEGHSSVQGQWASQTTFSYDGFGRETNRTSTAPGASGYTIYGTGLTHDIVEVKETGRVSLGTTIGRTTYDTRDALHRVTDRHDYTYSGSGAPIETKTEYLASGQVFKTTQYEAYTYSGNTYDKVAECTYDAIGRTRTYACNGIVHGGSATQLLNSTETGYYDNISYGGVSNCSAVFSKSTSSDPFNPSSFESSAGIVIYNQLGQAEWTFDVPKTASVPETFAVPTGSIMTHTIRDARGLVTEVDTGYGSTPKIKRFYDNAGRCIEKVALDTATTGAAEQYFFNSSGQTIAALTADYNNGALSNIKVNTVTVYDAVGRPYRVFHGVVPTGGLQWNNFSFHNCEEISYNDSGNADHVKTYGNTDSSSMGAYNAGNITGVTQYDDTQYVYDTLNRVSLVSYWRSGDSNPSASCVETRAYDFLGMLYNVTTYDRATSQQLSNAVFTHDANGNTTAETQTVGSSSTVTVNSVYDNHGFCTGKSIDSTNLAWTSGANNLPTRMTYGSETVATYTYTGGRMTSRANENGTNLAVTYDLYGAIDTYHNMNGSTHIASFDYGYDDQHRRVWQKYVHNNANDDRYDVFAYNGRDFVTGVHYQATDQYGANYESSDSFTYDNAGNRTTATVAENTDAEATYTYTGKDGSIEPAGGNANNEYYKIQINSNDPIYLNHDPRGNRVAYGSDTSAYDYANRLTSYKGETYVYDGNNRRLQVTAGSVTTRFVWDGWQCRQERDSGGNVTREFICGQGLDELLQMRWYFRGDATVTLDENSPHQTATITDSGAQWSVNLLQDKSITLTSGSTSHAYTVASNTADTITVAYDSSLDDFVSSGADYVVEVTFTYHTDAQGNVAALTDNTGQVIERIEYDIFGGITHFEHWNGSSFVSAPVTNGHILVADYFSNTITGNPYLFQSQRLDATGLYYFKNRYYDPENGRFITRDPAQDGLNLYAFVNNNPVNHTDPEGLEVYISDAEDEELGPEGRAYLCQLLADAFGNEDDSKPAKWWFDGKQLKGIGWNGSWNGKWTGELHNRIWTNTINHYSLADFLEAMNSYILMGTGKVDEAMWFVKSPAVVVISTEVTIPIIGPLCCSFQGDAHKLAYVQYDVRTPLGAVFAIEAGQKQLHKKISTVIIMGHGTKAGGVAMALGTIDGKPYVLPFLADFLGQEDVDRIRNATINNATIVLYACKSAAPEDPNDPDHNDPAKKAQELATTLGRKVRGYTGNISPVLGTNPWFWEGSEWKEFTP